MACDVTVSITLHTIYNRVFSQRQFRPFVMRFLMQRQTTTIFERGRFVVFRPNDVYVLFLFPSLFINTKMTSLTKFLRTP